MKDKSTEKYLLDILESIEAIEVFSKNITSSAELIAKHLERSAIERKLEIIGEALNKAKKLDPSFFIEDFDKIIRTRNIIVHDYDGINYRVVWDIIHNHLNQLKNNVIDLLEGYNKQNIGKDE